MKLFIFKNVPTVMLLCFIILADAQRSSNNLRDIDYQELARQNKITKQILEAFIQKKLGLRTTFVRPPSISDILPVKMPSEERTVRQSQWKEEISEPVQETQEYSEDDNLQSVESEQIDSVYETEGRKKYPTPPFEPELEPGSYRKR